MLFVTTDASMLPKVTQRDGLIVLPRLLKQSQREFEPESKKTYTLQPVSVSDFLVHWKQLEEGDEIASIHVHRMFEPTEIRAKTAGRLLLPHIDTHVYEALSSHSVRQIVDFLLQYRHSLNLELADLILEQIRLETDSWFLRPSVDTQGRWWRFLGMISQKLEWYTFDYLKNESQKISWKELLPDIYQKTQNRRVNIYATGYPSVAPATKVIQEIRKWEHVSYIELTQLQVHYPRIDKLVIIESLPSKERIEMISRSVFRSVQML